MTRKCDSLFSGKLENQKALFICAPDSMQSHATSCKGGEGAESGMERQGRSCEQEAGVAGGGRFAAVTIVISSSRFLE